MYEILVHPIIKKYTKNQIRPNTIIMGYLNTALSQIDQLEKNVKNEISELTKPVSIHT